MDWTAFLDGRTHPGIGDDHAAHAAKDAGRLAGGGGARAVLRLDRVPAGMDAPSPTITFLMYLPNFIWACVATLPAAMFQRMGRRIREARELGSYELIERLARAGWAKCGAAATAYWRVTRPSSWSGIECSARASRLRTQLRRFEREAQATATLNSQHTIRLFDFGAANDGSFYYVMELLNGRDLESLVNDSARCRRPARCTCSARSAFAGRSACARAGASRHEAGQHLRVPHGLSTSSSRSSTSAWCRPAGRSGAGDHRNAAYGGALDRHARLHGAGNDPRQQNVDAAPTSMPSAVWPFFCSPANAY